MSAIFLLWLLGSPALSLRIIQTDSKDFLPDLSGQAQILDSGLAGYDEVTVCARFLTFQFNCPPEAYDYQGMVTVGEVWLLGTYMALPCDWQYDGCTLYKKSYINDWKHGTAFGYYEKSNFYQSWEPGRWNSFCFTASSPLKEARVFLNGEEKLNFKEYASDHKNSGENIRLMNNHLSSNPAHGAVTEVNVWSRVLSESEVTEWSKCGSVQGEKVVDWGTAALNVSGLEVEEVDEQEVCKDLTRGERLMSFDSSLTFDGGLKFCSSVGGQIAVARDNSSFTEMMKLFNETCHHNDISYFYTGYTDREEHGTWRDVMTGEEMVWQNWLEDYPTSYKSDDCTYGDVTDKKVYNADCISKVCPVCQLEELKRFQLRGVCIDSAVDTYFVMTSNSEFLGLLKTRMIFSADESRWEIVNSSDSTNILAYMEPDGEGESSFPIGRHPWKFLDVNCSDPEQTVRHLNFHLDVPQPGQFCCDDGACIDSELVCNNFPDCGDRSDERDCSVVLFPDYTYNKDYPPVEFRNGKKESLEMFANLTVLNIFDINEVDSSFDFYFMILVQWFDKNLKFEFLKNGKAGNSIPERYQDELWMPHIEFDNTDKIVKTYKPELFVEKMSAPNLDGDIDQVNIKEIYSGQENPLSIQIKKRIKFSCSFNNIKNFPFGRQLCSMNFYVLGSDNQLTKFIPDQLINFGPSEIGQYVIENWEMKSQLAKGTEERIVEVSMILTRKIGSVFLVTYLPTILMNMINQVTNYINGDTRYDLVFTINITCMMVLASVYLSVSSSLPSTSDIKPVEIWLLFNLAYPFLVIFINVLLQSLEKQVIMTENSEKNKVTPLVENDQKTDLNTKRKSKQIYLVKTTAYYINPLIYIIFSFFYFYFYSTHF